MLCSCSSLKKSNGNNLLFQRGYRYFALKKRVILSKKPKEQNPYTLWAIPTEEAVQNCFFLGYKVLGVAVSRPAV